MLNKVALFLQLILLVVNGFPQLPNCGQPLSHSDIDWRIVGGTDAAEGEFPWQVLVTRSHELSDYPIANNYCGGSLINDRWVLTAAHCIVHPDTNNVFDADYLKMRLGVLNYSTIGQNEHDIYVEKLISHEHFEPDFTKSANDIGLIKLNSSVDFNQLKNLRPICLAREETNMTRCTASGFGFVTEDRKTPPGGILQKVSEPLAPISLCRKHFPGFNESFNVCAGGSQTGGKSVCEHDSGGPLQCWSGDGRWHQVGVVSYGEPCAHPNTPDVFTKVSYYIDWIDKVIATN